MYSRPPTTLGPFFIGLLLGNFMEKIQINLLFVYSRQLLIISFLIAIAIIYGILPEYWHPEQGNTIYNTLYTALFRTLFATTVAIMIIALYQQKK